MQVFAIFFMLFILGIQGSRNSLHYCLLCILSISERKFMYINDPYRMNNIVYNFQFWNQYPWRLLLSLLQIVGDRAPAISLWTQKSGRAFYCRPREMSFIGVFSIELIFRYAFPPPTVVNECLWYDYFAIWMEYYYSIQHIIPMYI